MPDGADDLYERDFYAWTQDQAMTLRAWPKRLRPNAVDIDHIAEEIEDLGISQRNAARSLIRQLVLHLLKLRLHPDRQAQRHWQAEVDNFRVELEGLFASSPSLKGRRAELADGEWERAARLFLRRLARDGHDDAAAVAWFSTSSDPYFDLDREVLDPDWFPSPG